MITVHGRFWENFDPWCQRSRSHQPPKNGKNNKKYKIFTSEIKVLRYCHLFYTKKGWLKKLVVFFIMIVFASYFNREI